MRLGRCAFLWVLVLLCLTGIAQAANLTVSVIDVGQGDSILVQFPNGRNMLVDAGTADAGRTVLAYLKSRGVKSLYVAVATHPHEDHIGGMVQVLNTLPIGKFWDSGYAHGSRTQREMLSTIERKGIRFGTPKAGFTERIGNATVSVLAPKITIPGSANDNSVVLRIVYGKTSFLLAADMEEKERHTVSRWPQSTVLKVAHHGSRNGTDPAFLAQVKPKVAVISSARYNPYGHPHKSTLDALKAAGTAAYITAQVGTVVLTSNGKNVTVKTLGTKQTSVVTSSTASGHIGNRNSHIFHLPTCSTLPNESNRVYFKSRDKAIAAGYRPCRRCKP